MCRSSDGTVGRSARPSHARKGFGPDGGSAAEFQARLYRRRAGNGAAGNYMHMPTLLTYSKHANISVSVRLKGCTWRLSGLIQQPTLIVPTACKSRGRRRDFKAFAGLEAGWGGGPRGSLYAGRKLWGCSGYPPLPKHWQYMKRLPEEFASVSLVVCKIGLLSAGATTIDNIEFSYLQRNFATDVPYFWCKLN